MASIPTGHRRTGLCPTFARPSRQRDGLLLRVPLVGGALPHEHIDVLAAVSGAFGTGVVELTNRGNLQLRGFGDAHIQDVLARCRAVGLGEVGASLVTVSPFAGTAEHRLRGRLVEVLETIDGLSEKFVVHVDDAEGSTAGRLADATLTLEAQDRCALAVRGWGSARLSVSRAVDIVGEVAAACAASGPFTRANELEPLSSIKWRPTPVQPERPLSLGVADRVDGVVAVAGARLGRLAVPQLATLGDIQRRFELPPARVTPWRSVAFVCTDASQGAAVLEHAAQAGLLTDPADPMASVITCIGRQGCWQTQLDTFAQVEQLLAAWPSDLQPGDLVHVSGCDKSCATRAPVARTLMGRSDSSGFDLR
ncbi:MAG: hypothetical protein JO057_08590 [Chloroflexi bacterium]|nr:hypothetical protein [Chloroflexota bacterium]